MRVCVIFEKRGEAVLLRPDEITSADTLTQAINTKSMLTLTIYPPFEAWGFAEQKITYVTALDLDRANDRVIFYGRVSTVRNRLDGAGRYSQEIVCGSAIEFLEDTISDIGSRGDVYLSTFVSDWLLGTVGGSLGHNSQLGDSADVIRRGFVPGNIGRAYVRGFIDMDTSFKTLADLLSGSEHLTYDGYTRQGMKMEFRDRFYLGVNHLDIDEKIGVYKTTPIKIGDNIKELQIERGMQECYTRVCVRSGVNSDGTRDVDFTTNENMAAIYPPCTKYIAADDIKCTAPKYDDYGNRTAEYLEMLSQLSRRSSAEAGKLSDTYVRITLSAADLAQSGMSDYEGFELGNTHPCVCPTLGLYGDDVRIVGLRRNLSDGKTVELTVESGDKPSGEAATTLSGQMAKVNRLEQRIDSSQADQTKVADGKITEALNGNKIRRMTKAQYDALTSYDDTVLYNVDNSGVNELYIGGTHISSGGGGDEPTIETAAVLSSEQMTEWAPEHALVPVVFRGSAHVYYAQPPARIVIQGQRGIFGTVTITTDDPAAELTFDFVQNGQTVRQKLKIYIYSVAYSGGNLSIMLGAACYSITGAAETLVGYGVRGQSITIPLPLSSVSIGLLLRVGSLTAQNSDEIVPQCRVQLGYIAGQNQGFWDIPSITGSLFNGSFAVDFGSAAERGFASGIARRTEPVYPNGGGGE